MANLPMMQNTRLSPRSLILGLLLGFLLLDQAVKIGLQQAMSVGDSWPILPDVFHLTLVYNTGAAFSLMNRHPELLLLLTSVIFGAFFLYSMTRKTYNGWQVAAFGLLLGGALGNITDRLLYGQVVDYLDFVLIRYPVFNLADSFIFCGIVLLVLQQLELLPGGRD